jgi:hypothetical protein
MAAALSAMLALTAVGTGACGVAARLAGGTTPASTARPGVPIPGPRPGTTRPAAPKPGTFAATITVTATAKPLGGITSHFAGLSFESDTLNGGDFVDSGNLPQLMRNLGPAIMRFGGLTVDDGLYLGISPHALAGLAGLARASGWTVLYSEDLAHYDPGVVTADAHEVAAALGPRLAAFACGNEPNAYGTDDGWRPASYTVDGYLADEGACLAAVRAGAPGAPLEGPDFTGNVDWLSAYAHYEAGHLALLGQHLYAARCVHNYDGRTALQADARLLSPATTATEVAAFKWLVANARIVGARPIMSETNSICSGGLAGVSNSFAAALWAVGYMLTGAEHGVYGMNFHDRFDVYCTPYSPLCPVPGRAGDFTVRPLYYGMLFAHLLGTGRLLPVTVRTPVGRDRVLAFALRPATGGGLRLIVENLTAEQARVTLAAGGSARSARVLRLTASGLTATSGVRIQGATVQPNGTIRPGPPTVITCSPGRCQLALPPYSAALITFP